MDKFCYRIYRTSTFQSGHRPENDHSYLELRKRLDGKLAMENWYIDFESLDQLMNFASQYFPIIIKKPTYENTVGDIEIYDIQREDKFIDLIIN